MTWTIRIPKWDEFQHYEKRSPVWIKLYRKTLDKRAWRDLSGPAAKLLVDLWMLAAEGKGEITLSLADVAWRLRLGLDAMTADLQTLATAELVEIASSSLAACKQPASPEERRGETEQSRESQLLGADAPEAESPIGRLMGLVRKHLYRGDPPGGWNPARDGSILKRLLASGVSPETCAAAIEGLAVLRDWPGKYGKPLDWLKPGEKATMRTLWHTRSGDYQTFQLALDACWKRHNVGKPPLPPTLREVLAKMVA